MDSIINAALPVLVGMVIGYALAWFLAIRGLTKGVQVLLRAKLRQDRNYFARKGITYEQKADYEVMYKAYHEMGKNGVMTECYEAVLAMKPLGSQPPQNYPLN